MKNRKKKNSRILIFTMIFTVLNISFIVAQSLIDFAFSNGAIVKSLGNFQNVASLLSIAFAFFIGAYLGREEDKNTIKKFVIIFAVNIALSLAIPSLASIIKTGDINPSIFMIPVELNMAAVVWITVNYLISKTMAKRVRK